MKAGELKHRITLQIFTIVVNENGFKVETWIDFKTLWVAVTNLHGREYFAVATAKSENTVKFTIRYTEDIDEGMGILFKASSIIYLRLLVLGLEIGTLKIKLCTL